MVHASTRKMQHFAAVSTSALTCTQEQCMASSNSNPVIESFLSFLAEDIVRFPEQITPLDPTLSALIDALVGHSRLAIYSNSFFYGTCINSKNAAFFELM